MIDIIVVESLRGRRGNMELFMYNDVWILNVFSTNFDPDFSFPNDYISVIMSFGIALNSRWKKAEYMMNFLVLNICGAGGDCDKIMSEVRRSGSTGSL